MEKNSCLPRQQVSGLMSNVVTECLKSPLSDAFAREARVTSVKNPLSVNLVHQSHIREVSWNAAISCDVNHTYNENHINNIHDTKKKKYRLRGRSSETAKAHRG
eukprot:TRINITY_DN2746_c0_g1_i1.p1 TRINITY_DN2746_c0_g1~~TRINITY_DN2746_c0_g1_i1.p1  ORF type:complete len:104 (+),score=26.35 TRINITY_DN2746_c0_g1_i1:194-505(+)